MAAAAVGAVIAARTAVATGTGSGTAAIAIAAPALVLDRAKPGVLHLSAAVALSSRSLSHFPMCPARPICRFLLLLRWVHRYYHHRLAWAGVAAHAAKWEIRRSHAAVALPIQKNLAAAAAVADA